MCVLNFKFLTLFLEDLDRRTNFTKFTLFYTNKYQKHVPCSYSFKLVCVVDGFCKLLKLGLDEDVGYKFSTSMTEKSKYCSNVMKKHFWKELLMTKKDDEDFEISAE